MHPLQGYKGAIMSLKHAILGFLNYQPASGYELKASFDSSVRHFWPADQAQIYRTLADLTKEDLASMEVVPQQDRPNKKVYHITEAGRAELRRWLLAPLPPSDHRSAELIQIFFAGQLSDEEALTIFERLAQHCRAALAVLEQIPQQITEYTQMVGSPRETFFWLLTLEEGIHSTRCLLEWEQSVIERLKNNRVPQE
jgi:DNA-binding PadR family transcriptional regulator